MLAKDNDDDDSWCVIKQYVKVFTFGSNVPPVRDPRLLYRGSKNVKGYVELRVKKRLVFVSEDSFNVSRLNHVDKLEKRVGRDWSDYHFVKQ